MKYCVRYNRNFKYKADEIILSYKDNKDNSNFIDFIKNNADTRIIVDLDTKDLNYSILIAVAEGCSNLVYRIPENLTEAAEKFSTKKIPFFFNTYINTWPQLVSIVREWHPSDVYIIDDLAFDMKTIAANLHKEDSYTNIRVFPNVAQTQEKFGCSEARKFFIRPEDIHLYEGLVDVMELFINENTLNPIFKAYTMDKCWAGPLYEVIVGMDSSSNLNGIYIDPRFGSRRVKCGKRCLYSPSCRMCDTIESLCESLEKRGIRMKVNRHNKE